MSTAQIAFSVALGSIALFISFFALYLVSTTFWGDRWIRRNK